jgi:hypothetical protein
MPKLLKSVVILSKERIIRDPLIKRLKLDFIEQNLEAFKRIDAIRKYSRLKGNEEYEQLSKKAHKEFGYSNRTLVWDAFSTFLRLYSKHFKT